MKKLSEFTIVLAEDDHLTLEVVAKFLRPLCKHLYLAENGATALQLFEAHKPDLVITDIEMPKLSGLELAKIIRRKSISTQIIILTAYRRREYLLEAVNLQLTQYLLKPLSFEKIMKALQVSEAFLASNKLDAIYVFSKHEYYDKYRKEFFYKNEVVKLSKCERDLLELLIRMHPAPAPYRTIASLIFDKQSAIDATKRVVTSLRDKIEEHIIISIPAYGYKLKLMTDD